MSQCVWCHTDQGVSQQPVTGQIACLITFLPQLLHTHFQVGGDNPKVEGGGDGVPAKSVWKANLYLTHFYIFIFLNEVTVAKM
jgi:hypothetical protein